MAMQDVMQGKLATALPRVKAKRGLPRLWLMTDAVRLADPLPAVAALPRGAGVIFRHYGSTSRARLGQALARLCRARGLVLLVAEDAGLARRLRADGLHLPERATARIGGLRRRHPGWLLTVAAHGIAALRRGRAADAFLISPVFPTASHPGAAGLGPLRFASLVRTVRRPAIALGGVKAGTLPRLRGSGAYGIAGIDWGISG